MSQYKLTVIRQQPNENYAEELVAYNKRQQDPYRHFDGAMSMPTAATDERVLELIVSETELEAIRKAVLETFK